MISCYNGRCRPKPRANFFSNEFPRGHYLVWLVRVRVNVTFSLGVRVSGMIRVTVDVRVMVRVSN